MDKAPDFGSGDCRFESCHGRVFLFASSDCFTSKCIFYYCHLNSSIVVIFLSWGQKWYLCINTGSCWCMSVAWLVQSQILWGSLSHPLPPLAKLDDGGTGVTIPCFGASYLASAWSQCSEVGAEVGACWFLVGEEVRLVQVCTWCCGQEDAVIMKIEHFLQD